MGEDDAFSFRNIEFQGLVRSTSFGVHVISWALSTVQGDCHVKVQPAGPTHRRDVRARVLQLGAAHMSETSQGDREAHGLMNKS